MTRRIPGPRRAAFTLIELLVVIAIIAVLVALTSAGISNVRVAAKRAAASAEIAQLGSAVGAFKSKLNVTYLPAFQPGSNAGNGFRLCTSYDDPANPGQWLQWPEVTYLKQLFPQMSRVDNGLRFPFGSTTPVLPASPHVLDPNQALLFFLTGSTYTNFQGFSTNKQMPFTAPGGGQAIGPFVDVNSGKLSNSNNSGTPATVPWYLDPFGQPYAYFSFDPNINQYPTGATWPTTTVSGPAGIPLAPAGLVAYLDGTNRPFQTKGFQIISAGANKVFGPGGNWTPGSGAWVLTGPGGDDLSNFNAGQLAQQSSN